MIVHIQQHLLQGLSDLEKEINSFPDDKSLWETKGDVKNSAGTLCLHLCGNLWHFIGAGISKNGFIRDREGEFSERGYSKQELILRIENTGIMVNETLNKMVPGQLTEEFPFLFHDEKVTTGLILVKITWHLGYHLGQVNYLRRMI